jgi:hypothetical protein
MLLGDTNWARSQSLYILCLTQILQYCSFTCKRVFQGCKWVLGTADSTEPCLLNVVLSYGCPYLYISIIIFNLQIMFRRWLIVKEKNKGTLHKKLPSITLVLWGHYLVKQEVTWTLALQNHDSGSVY